MGDSGSTISVAAGKTVTFNAKVGSTEGKTIAISAVKADVGGLSIKTDSTNAAIVTGKYVSGGITFGAGFVGVLTVTSGAVLNDISATGMTLEVSDVAGTTNFNGNVAVKAINVSGTNAPKINFFGATVKATEDSTIGTLTNISQNTDATFEKKLTVSSGATLNVLGKMTVKGQFIQDGATVGTPAGPNDTAAHIIKSGATSVLAEVDVSTVAGIEEAVKLGILKLNSTDLVIDRDVTIPAGTNLACTGTLTIGVAAGVGTSAKYANFTNEGTVTANGIALTEGEAADKRNVYTNEGTTTICHDAGAGALTVPVNTTFINEGTLKMTGSATIVGMFENSGTFETKTDATIVPASTITIGDGTVATEFENTGKIILAAGTVTVNNKSVLINSGSIDTSVTTGDEPTITGAGTFNNLRTGVVGIAVNTQFIEGTTYTVKITEDITQKVTYMSLQQVLVPADANLTIKSVAQVTIQGLLTIDGTITVEGKLVIAAGSDTAAAAKLIAKGKIIIADGGEVIIGGTAGKGEFTITEGCEIAVPSGGKLTVNDTTGKLDVAGTLSMQTGSILAVNGEFNVDKTGSAFLDGYFVGSVTVNNSGIVELDNGSNDVRSGIVASDGSNVTINMAADGASFLLKSYLFENVESKIIITDSGLVTYTATNGDKTSIPEDNCNTITIGYTGSTTAAVKKIVANGDLKVVESASSKNITSYGRAQTYSMDVSGAVSADITFTGTAPTSFTNKVTMDLEAAKTTYFERAGAITDKAQNTGKMVVSQALDLGAYVAATFADGKFDVSGTITNTAAGAKQMVVFRTAVIDVTGLITSNVNAIDNSAKGTINAAYYVIKTTGSTVSVHNYSTLSAAISAVADATNVNNNKDVTVMGEITLTESVDVPAGIAIVFDAKAPANTLFVGDKDHRDVIMTVAAGAKITTNNSNQVTVLGTLTFVNKTNDETQKTVSDVTVEDESVTGSRTYTNIYTAVRDAGASGEETVITITRAAGDTVKLTENLTVPENVTLVVQDAAHGAGLMLMNGVTLTVDGTLQTSQDILAETRFADKAMNVESTTTYSSAVVVNGLLAISADINEIKYGSGAVGTTSLVANAPVYGVYYELNDKWNVISSFEIALGNVEDMTSDMTVYGPVVGADGTFTPGEYADIITVEDDVINSISGNGATIATSLTVGSLTLGTGAKVVTTGSTTGSFVVGDASVDIAEITGATIANTKDKLTIEGTVNATAEKASFEVAAGTVYLKDVTYESGAMDIDMAGALTVAAGATAIVDNQVNIDAMIVNGTFTVASGDRASVEYLEVYGTVDVAASSASSAPGVLEVGVALIGMNLDDFCSTGATATVNGPMDADIACVLAGSVVDEANFEGMKSTAFNVDGALWFTAYADSEGRYVLVNKAPLTNAKLAGWSDEADGEIITSEISAKFFFEIGEYDALYAVVETEIYNIFVLANQGINDVYIDGAIMEKGMMQKDGAWINGYKAVVKAGDHKITFTLANGFSGEGKLTVNGVAASGFTFTTTGTPGEKGAVLNYDLQITGIEKTGYVPDSPDTDNGMTITDYLLIVLVVLIVVMAIIVALRMMRS